MDSQKVVGKVEQFNIGFRPEQVTSQARAVLLNNEGGTPRQNPKARLWRKRRCGEEDANAVAARRRIKALSCHLFSITFRVNLAHGRLRHIESAKQ